MLVGTRLPHPTSAVTTTTITSAISTTCHSSSLIALSASKGFGSGATSSSKKNKNNNKKNKQSAWLQQEQQKQEPVAPKSEGPLLDKWGFPPPTLEDIFPPLPSDTELIPLESDDETFTLTEIQHWLRNHISLKLDTCLDEPTAREKSIHVNNNNRQPMQLKLLHKSPPVLCVEHFLTPDECRQVELVTQLEDDRQVVQVQSATFALSQSTRTSTSWFCHFAQVPTLLAKMQHVLGVKMAHMEEPQLVRYQPGQEFSWHYDEVPALNLQNGGQRLATLLVYTNELGADSGGATVFRDLRDAHGQPLAVQPQLGRALLFFPALHDGTPDDRTLHQGQLAQKEKRLVQVWIHERDYQPVLPRGNSQAAAQAAVERARIELGYSQADDDDDDE